MWGSGRGRGTGWGPQGGGPQRCGRGSGRLREAGRGRKRARSEQELERWQARYGQILTSTPAHGSSRFLRTSSVTILPNSRLSQMAF